MLKYFKTNTFLNNLWVKEKSQAWTKGNRKDMYQNLWDATIAVLWSKFRVLNPRVWKKEQSQINNLNFHL